MIERITTNSGRNTTGKPILGLEVEQLFPTGIGLFTGVGLIACYQMMIGSVPEWVFVTGICLIVFPLIWAVVFVRGKPPNFQRDFFRTYFLLMGSWWRTPKSLSAAFISRGPCPLVRGVLKEYRESVAPGKDA